MKKLILPVIVFYSFCYPLFGKNNLLEKQTSVYLNNIHVTGRAIQTSSIDQLDSVLFDLSQAVFTSNTVEIPVSIVSNDTIFALDFSFQYNQNNILYDSIIDLTNYMVSSSFYNMVDSTVRFTSYGTQSYSLGTVLVSVKFNLLNGMLGVNDLLSLTAYLNGDPCSIILKGNLPTNVYDNEKNNDQIKLYPSPAFNSFHITSSFDGIMSIVDLNGRVVIKTRNIFKNQDHLVDIRSLPNGNYWVLLSNEGILRTRKLTVFH